MTDKIKGWRLRLIVWLEKRQVKEKQSEIQNFKESVLLGLQQLETEESIEVFSKINEEYKNLMLKRLGRVAKEKFNLEEFLGDTLSSVSKSFARKRITEEVQKTKDSIDAREKAMIQIH